MTYMLTTTEPQNTSCTGRESVRRLKGGYSATEGCGPQGRYLAQLCIKNKKGIPVGPAGQCSGISTGWCEDAKQD